MSLAITLVAIFVLSQTIIFATLLYFAVQFVRVKRLTLEADDNLPLLWDEIADLRTWSKNTQEWADSMTELQVQIVDRFQLSNDEEDF